MGVPHMGSASTSQLDVGHLLGDYEILSVAGIGGMGVVYKARQRSLGRDVALKVIRDEIAREAEYRERFLREARLAAAVDHPHVVSVYDVGDADSRLYLAMQWVNGQDLRRILEYSGRLSRDRAVAIVIQIAGALDAVHGVAGLVHRDVKPANVLIRHMDGTDHAYLSDFGVAKPSDAAEQLTHTGWTVGTVGYLSPEQIRGGEPTGESDLYALGCLFFEALTGRPPFIAENEMGLRWAHANDPRPKVSALLPDLGISYDAFIETALAVDPSQRFQSGRQFADTLKAVSSGAEPLVAAAVVPPHAPTAVGPPTPIPPPGASPTPIPPQPGYGYQTPAPPYPQRARSGNPVALILLALVALAGIAVGALAAAGVFSHQTSTQTLTRISKTSQTSPTTKTRPPRLQPATTAPPVAVPPSARTPCGGDVSVGPNTSCGFAENVEQAYLQTSGGDTDVTAYSPATGLTYTMHCTGGSPHVCTGARDASVYFASSPGATQSTTAPSQTGGTRACDQNISANANTSCPFAENVFRSYARDYQANGEQSDDVISAFSPVTGQSYQMDCTNDGVTVNCSGANGAFVTFPMHAVQVY